MDSSITVAVRVRPVTSGTARALDVVDDKMLVFDPSPKLGEIDPNTIRPGNKVGSHNYRRREHKFVFDRVFDELSTQDDIHLAIGRPILDNVFDGYNSTVFAYGATGCGKTFTISGSSEQPGIVFSTMKELFARKKGADDTEVDITLSYLEIYNETIRDLLNAKTSSSRLQMREVARKQVYVTNLSQHHPQNVQQVMDLIILGSKHRTVSPTAANAVSSRSHAVLQITVSQRKKAQVDSNCTTSLLSFIDLAGSERASSTKNRGMRLYEGANINKSLLALGNCINALCDEKHGYVPYRDSKLTRLLKFSLDGNCKTIMIVCVSPAVSHYDETLNALKYANRAKAIKTKVMKNQSTVDAHLQAYIKVIAEQSRQIEQLKSDQNKLVTHAVEVVQIQRENCHREILAAADSLSESIDKCGVKAQKALMLSKKQLLLFERANVDQFIRSSSLASGEIQLDDQFQLLIARMQDLLITLDQWIEELKYQFIAMSELDLIFGSTATILEQLQKIEGWSIYDQDLFDAKVQQLKLETARSIQKEATVIFEQAIPKFVPFGFVFDSLFESLVDSDFATTANVIVQELLEDRLDLMDSTGITPQAANLDLSPKRLTPAKRSHQSPGNTPTRSYSDKKVRWGQNLNRSDEPMIMAESTPMSPHRLTDRKLEASPKIHSPGRITGLGVATFQRDAVSKGKQLLPFLLPN